MEVIREQKKLEDLVKFSSNEKKRICRVGISGNIHDGHILVLNKVKQECDILIADINEYIFKPWRNLLGLPIDQVRFGEIDRLEVEKKLKELGIVDFLIFNNSTREYKKQSLEFILKYKDKFYEHCNSLGLSRDLAVNCLIFGLLSPIDNVTTSYVGPKCITQVKIAEKIFGAENRWSPEIIWDFHRNSDGGSVSRSRGSTTLSKSVLNVVNELKRGVADFENLNKTFMEYYMEDPRFTIIDLDTVEKLNHITNNCSLIFMDGIKSDFVHIKDGKLVF